MKTLVILGHPRTKSFCGAIANSYIKGIKRREIRFIEISKLKFDPIFRKEKHGKQKMEPDLKKAQKDILWADHLVFIYPLWWGSMPALLKGFLDRTFTAGFALKYSEHGYPIGLLKGKSARIILTMDAPPFFYRLLLGDPGIKVMKRCILKECGIKPVKVTKLGPIHKSTKQQRKKWLQKIHNLNENYH